MVKLKQHLFGEQTIHQFVLHPALVYVPFALCRGPFCPLGQQRLQGSKAAEEEHTTVPVAAVATPLELGDPSNIKMTSGSPRKDWLEIIQRVPAEATAESMCRRMKIAVDRLLIHCRTQSFISWKWMIQNLLAAGRSRKTVISVALLSPLPPPWLGAVGCLGSTLSPL